MDDPALLNIEATTSPRLDYTLLYECTSSSLTSWKEFELRVVIQSIIISATGGS